MMSSVPDYGSHDDVVVEDDQRQLSSFRKAALMIALVAGVVVGVTMMGYSTAAPAAAPAATADVAAMSVEDAKAAAMRDFGEVTAETIETEATMAKYGVRLAEAVSASCNCEEAGCCDTCTKGTDYCSRQEADGKNPCGWGGGAKCSGCAGVCDNPDFVVEIVDWAPSDLCAHLPGFINKDPDDIVSLAADWKLQLPCLEIATGSNGASYCTDDRTSLINGNAAGNGVFTVYMTPENSPGSYTGPYLQDFRLMPKAYGDAGQFCSGGMYAATDGDGVEMVVLNVPIAGSTTTGSKNPRVELRQMLGNANAGFDLDETVSEANKLTTTQSVVHVPANYKSTSVVQVFNGGYDEDGTSFAGGGPFIEIITQKCQYSWQKIGDTSDRCPAGSIGIGVWKDGKFGGKGGYIFEEYTLGTKFDLEVEVPGDGSVTMRYKHSGAAEWASEYTFDCDDGAPAGGNPCLAGQSGDAAYPTANGVYFKVGSYVQKAPDEAATDYALSYMYSAVVTGPATGRTTD